MADADTLDSNMARDAALLTETVREAGAPPGRCRMKYFWPILLQALAFGVGFAEIMVISFGLLAALCVALSAYSWYYIVNNLPHGAAIAFGVADVILVPVAIKFGFNLMGRSPISHGSSLGSGSGFETRDAELQKHVGATAQVEAPLRPVGKIRIGSDVFEAQTSGEFVERGVTVKISGIRGSGFLVEKQEKT